MSWHFSLDNEKSDSSDIFTHLHIYIFRKRRLIQIVSKVLWTNVNMLETCIIYFIWMLGPVDRHNPESDRNCHQQSSIYYLITQNVLFCAFLNKNNELSVPSLSIHRWDIVVNEGVLLCLFWILLQEATQKSSWIRRLAGDVELTLDMDKDINSETILSAYTFLAQEHLAFRGQQNLIQRVICLTFGCQHVVQIGCS